MLYEFKKGNSAAEAAKNIHSVYEKECVNEKTCCRWFAKFRTGDFTLEDEGRTERLVEFNDELLKAALEENPVLSVEELTIKLSSNIQLFIVIFKNLEKFLNLGNGCLMNCLKTISNRESTSALLSILASLFHLFWIDL